ncbi:MAG: hypothetical protein ABS938_08690 [Psychrobacillus psychrodurans]
MVQMRTIGINMDRGYREDLNFNFSKLETMVTSASNLTEEMRQEFLLKIADLQSQINSLNVEEILALISQMEQAVISANTAATKADAKALYADEKGTYAQTQGTYATEKGDYANEKGDYANEKAILANEAAALAQQESSNLGQMKIDVVQATQDANTATQEAITATTNAEQATTATIKATTDAENIRSVGAFVLPNAYKKNNIVEDKGSSFIALQDTQNNPLPVLPTKENAWWRLVAQKGDKGNDGTGVTILGSLTSESELPEFGSPGDAYLVDGLDVDNNPIKNLYVWSDSTTSWTNAGNIQGPQGETGGQGIQGEKGDPGTTKWSGITDKPTSFPSTIPSVTGLQDALDLKFKVADGGVLDDLTTVTKDNLVAAINEINAKPTGGDTTELSKQINTLYKLSTSLLRYQAYDELFKDASQRLKDGRGTVIAHDMNGNIIKMTLDEANSQNIVIRDGKMMMLAKSEVTKTVTDTTVINQAYDTSGNGGRKIVRLDNGTLVVVVRNTTVFEIYKSLDGTNWTQIATQMLNAVDASLSTDGVQIFLIYTYGTFVIFRRYTESGSLTKQDTLDSGTAVGNCSMITNEAKTEVHATWVLKNGTYPNSFNSRYAKGVISQVDGSITWGAVEQLTSYNASDRQVTYPSIILNADGNPFVLATFQTGTTYQIVAIGKGISNALFSPPPPTGWGSSLVHNGGTYTHLSPSAIFVPQSVNGLTNGRIWVAWYGRSVEYPTYQNIYATSSDDGGATWAVVLRLTSSNSADYGNVMMPSITADKTNKVTVVFEVTGSLQQLRQMHNVNGGWNSTQETIKVVGVNHSYPSTLFDDTFSSNSQTIPPLIFMGIGKVGFYGTWKEPVETPTLTAKAVYDIPSTDFVGAFVKKIGSTNVQAYVNDVLADEELVDSEYQFTKQLDIEAPIKLRLELSRPTIDGGENDAVTRILGGIA